MPISPDDPRVDDDVFHAWILACNCLLYEADRGPQELMVTTNDGQQGTMPRSLAWQYRYARHVVVKLDGDLDRMCLAAQAARHRANERAGESAAQYRRAADLCERAAHMVRTAGGEANRSRGRELATRFHYGHLQGVVGVFDRSVARDLTRRVRRRIRAIRYGR